MDTGRPWRLGGLTILLMALAFMPAPAGARVLAQRPHIEPASASGTWGATSAMVSARVWHTATLLPSGQVLVTGGSSVSSSALAGAELYDPHTGMWTATGNMTVGRFQHTATLLPNGQVLIAGGCCYQASAELYNPATGTFTATGAMSTARVEQSATLLPNGTVLIAGGYNPSSYHGLASAELYTPATGLFTPTGAMTTARYGHTATLLANGNVLVVGGNNGRTATAELYDPGSGTWTATGAPGVPRRYHTATLLRSGAVLIAGGTSCVPCPSLASAALYNPATGTFTATGALSAGRQAHTATLLRTGQVLLAGGTGATAGAGLASAELYDPASGTFTTTLPMSTGRYGHTATLLPSGQVLVAGGSSNGAPDGFASAELYTPRPSALAGFSPDSIAFGPQLVGTVGATQTMSVTNLGQTPLRISGIALSGPNAADFAQTSACVGVSLAPGGSCGLLLSFGPQASGPLTASISLTDNAPDSPQSRPLYGYGSTLQTWAPTGSMTTPRSDQAAALLPNGKLLVAGGCNGYFCGTILSSAELYDPRLSTWTATGAMSSGRNYPTATLLPNGRVLVTSGGVGSSELYDPSSGAFTSTSAMSDALIFDTATLLSGGLVLVAGGCCVNHNGAELYDPATNRWTATGAMNDARSRHSATALPNGLVLVAGGQGDVCSSLGGCASVATAELYNPATGAWTTTGSMNTARDGQTATLLPNGHVLVAGGETCIYNGNTVTCTALATAELYDPSSGTWTPTGAMTTARNGQQAALLPDGDVLVAGGEICVNNNGIVTCTMLATAELYDPSSGTWTAAAPMMTARNGYTLSSATSFTLSALPTAQVLAAGGDCCGTAEVYTTGAPPPQGSAGWPGG